MKRWFNVPIAIVFLAGLLAAPFLARAQDTATPPATSTDSCSGVHDETAGAQQNMSTLPGGDFISGFPSDPEHPESSQNFAVRTRIWSLAPNAHSAAGCFLVPIYLTVREGALTLHVDATPGGTVTLWHGGSADAKGVEFPSGEVTLLAGDRALVLGAHHQISTGDNAVALVEVTTVRVEVVVPCNRCLDYP